MSLLSAFLSSTIREAFEMVAKRAKRSAVVDHAPKRIKVIEKPGADYKAPPHTRGDGECWCMPETETNEEEGVLYVYHREFDN